LPIFTAFFRVSTLRTLRQGIPFAPVTLLLSFLLSTNFVVAQKTQTAPQTPAPEATSTPAQPHGEVLFQSHGEPPITPENSTAPALASPPIDPNLYAREALTAYDLDARLTPASSSLAMRARVTLRNIGTEPLPRLVLQISSSLQWESITLNGQPLPLTQHLLDTDADHTGKVSEAVLTLPRPLAPGASLTLDTLYSGAIATDATRLERIGASAAQALDTDWDAIGNTALASSSDPTETPIILNTALRGFGNVLWYPVAAPPLFLGDGAKLFQAVGAMRLSNSSATIHLRLSVEYQGDPPTAAYFCGRRQPLTALPDDPNLPTASGSGIATADFPPQPIGFRLPSLFLIERPETLIAPVPQPESSSSEPATTPGAPSSADSSIVGQGGVPYGATTTPMLAVETTNVEPLPRLATTAQTIAPLLQQWFGPHPLTALTILDHAGQPFEDGPLLVAPITTLAAETSAPALVHSLTYAWVQTGQPWFDEGLAQFAGLLWTEQQQGRAAAIQQLTDLLQPVALAEPALSPPTTNNQQPTTSTDPIGQPLTTATDDLYCRRKAAAVWWMLRGIAGDQPLASALTQWTAQPASHDTGPQQAIAFEKLLEKTSGKDLTWFFADWILRDRGLPDLTIAAVEPIQLPAGKGHDSGWLVAITVHNDGAAAAEVPVIIRSGTFSTTKRLRIPGFSSATDRVLVEAPPTQVLVNDGSTPEVRTSTHTQAVVLKSE
jgi:hypothetical protein